jgi:hypothetical protein
VKRVSNVPMFEALWDMSEADMSSVYSTYTSGLQQAAAVLVGGGVRAVVSSLATVVGGWFFFNAIRTCVSHLLASTYTLSI